METLECGSGSRSLRDSPSGCLHSAPKIKFPMCTQEVF